MYNIYVQHVYTGDIHFFLCQKYTDYSNTTQDWLSLLWLSQSRNYPNAPKGGNILKLSRNKLEYFCLHNWHALAATDWHVYFFGESHDLTGHHAIWRMVREHITGKRGKQK